MSYSLIEIKLRRFIYLGNKNSIYVNPIHQTTFWKSEKDRFELNGIQLIGKIFGKNKTKEINSIIPIILKIDREKKLENYMYLIYLLAVCAKFQNNEYPQLSKDAYAAIGTICKDGYQLLMFFKFCNSAAKILHRQGYITEESLGFGRGARRAFKKWYLERNPLETIESIVKQKKFCGISHKSIMNTIHFESKDPSHKIYIVYIRGGLKKMENMFEPSMKEVNDVNEEVLISKEQRCIYQYIKLVHRIDNVNDSKLLSETKWSILGKHFNFIVPKMLQSTKILISFVQHLPLKTLLENTYSFHKHGLFKNLLGQQGLIEFVSRFKNQIAVNESGIHPIDSYLEFLRYERSGAVIASIKKKKKNDQNMWFATNEMEQKCSDDLELGIKVSEYKPKKRVKYFPNSHLFFMKPIPVPLIELQQFLSMDLVEKTMKNLKPSGRQLLIAYDNRQRMESVPCHYMHVKFVRVIDAIVLIIMSIVSQEKSNQPTICALFDPVHKFKFVQVNYQVQLTATYFQKCLFKKQPKNSKRNQMDRSIRPLSTINWARNQKKMFDVFLFLGTTKMDLQGIRKAKANYEAISKSKIKIIICCLNGNHSERVNLSRDGLLLITGFDKNTARVINLFINNTF